ncbi:hypothetical protein RRG08_047548 [Elysia crispata]|uniref:Uncharacterized protein n=1 Tax=Elysia crispata TaxID=231223 RepID=A0AAE1D241_9GAST|nr:hypothetical protein RRG08_047548 [Elysia crispata]
MKRTSYFFAKDIKSCKQYHRQAGESRKISKAAIVFQWTQFNFPALHLTSGSSAWNETVKRRIVQDLRKLRVKADGSTTSSAGLKLLCVIYRDVSRRVLTEQLLNGLALLSSNFLNPADQSPARVNNNIDVGEVGALVTTDIIGFAKVSRGLQRSPEVSRVTSSRNLPSLLCSGLSRSTLYVGQLYQQYIDANSWTGCPDVAIVQLSSLLANRSTCPPHGGH